MASLLVNDGSLPARNKLGWKWVSSGVAPTAFADPAMASGYALCIYDSRGLKLAARLPAGGTCNGKPCWKKLGTTGFRFHDNDGTSNGLTSVLLEAGGARPARIKVGGRGSSLPLPTLPFETSVRVQLRRGDAGGCWEATYSVAITNDANTFRAKGD